MSIKVIESLSQDAINGFAAGVGLGAQWSAGECVVEVGQSAGCAEDWGDGDGDVLVYWACVTRADDDDNATYRLIDGALEYKHCGVEV